MSKADKKDFTFINEHIKNKPFYKKKWFTRTGAAIGLAIIFGGVAGLIFAIVTPWAQQKFGEPQKPTQILIAEETETEKSTEKSSEKLSQKQTQKPTEKQTETKVTEKQSETNPPKQAEAKKELELDDYKRLYTLMHGVAYDALKSVVTVTGSTSKIDWFNEESENHVQASGLIVTDNGQNMFILTEVQAIENAERIRVTFPDSTIVDAELQKQDRITGLALVKIASGKVPQETRDYIDTTAFGNAASVSQGTPVIVLGSPLGYSNSMSFGMVTSIQSISLEDREYNQIQTDVIANGEGSGILVDLNGKVVGFITRNTMGEEEKVTVAALAASEIIPLVENLTNNVDMAYMGIIGKEVTKSVMEETGIPAGIYVKEAVGDSPAMYAGIQTADVLVSINDKTITDINDYMDILQELKPEEVVKVTLMRRGMDNAYAQRDFEVMLGKVQ